jgi:hypothetical protein
MLGSSHQVPRLRSILCAFALLIIAGALAPASANFESDFEGRMFNELAGLYAKDHTLIRHTDGVYHIFYSRGNAGLGWNLGSETAIGHATSPDLIHWSILGTVLEIDVPHNWKERNLWAPHVLKVDMVIGGQQWAYVMAYTGVDSLRAQQIGIAVSQDLNTWTDLSINNGALRPNPAWALWQVGLEWQNCRDPFLIKQGNQLMMLTSVQTRPEYQNLGTRGAIAIATSTNGLTWTDSGGPLLANDHSSLLASSHMEQNPVSSLWQLFYTRTIAPGGVYTLSSSLLDQGWVLSNAQQFDPLAISSEITNIPGEVVYSRAVDYLTQGGLGTFSVRLDRVTWGAGGPTLTPVNLFADQWTQVSGSLGAMPTFRDRPGFRGGPVSNLQGLFWVNTAENCNGPFQGGNATSGASETLTGVLRSKTYTSNGLTMELLVGGSASAQAYVALVDSVSGAVLQEAHGLGTEVMSQRVWNVAQYAGDRVYLEIRDNTTTGHVSVDDIQEVGNAVGVPSAPPVSALTQLTISPNPAAGPMNLSYDLGQSSGVVMAIYDPAGRLVRELPLGTQAAGKHAISWDGRNREGRPVSAGVYFVRMLLDGAPFTTAATRVTIVR